MTNPHGSFVWYELITPHPDAAAAFYGPVLGWTVKPSGHMGMAYRLIDAGDGEIGGMMAPPEPGMPAGWFGYIAVDDVDRVAADVVAAGGKQCVAPTDIPGVGRFAFLTDPQGVSFYVMRDASDQASTAFAMRPGHCGWNELSTSDQNAALDFYTGHFGWVKGDAMPMGPLGEYRFIEHGGAAIGAIMNRPPDSPPANWTFYFVVPDIDVATARVKDGGGAVHFGPAEVPGGHFVIVASDPHGALFGLVGPRNQGEA